MPSYEYLIIDAKSEYILGTFNDLGYALIFINGYYEEYSNDPNLILTIIKQEKGK